MAQNYMQSHATAEENLHMASLYRTFSSIMIDQPFDKA